jgi:calmodulin
MSSRRAQPTPDFDSVLEAFSTFDMHNGGYMSMSELLHLMKSLGEGLSDKTLQQVQNVAEPDTDGQVGLGDWGQCDKCREKRRTDES